MGSHNFHDKLNSGEYRITSDGKHIVDQNGEFHGRISEGNTSSKGDLYDEYGDFKGNYHDHTDRFGDKYTGKK